MRIELNGDRPVYLQVAEHFRSKILSGELQPAFALPTVREFAEELGVSV